MSVINLITAMQPSTSLTGKKSTVQTVATAQPQPATNTSSVTISSDAMRRANYEKTLAEISAGTNSMRELALRDGDASSPAIANFAYTMAYADNTDGGGGGGAMDISQTLPPGDGILRYSSGETVTVESKAYFTREETRYRQERMHLYESEVAKKHPQARSFINCSTYKASSPNASVQ